MNGELITVKLHGHLGRKFGRVHRMAVNSPAEAVRGLMCKFPGFRKYMIKNSEPGFHVVCGKTERDKEELVLPTGAKVIRFVPAVKGGNSPWVKIIMGAVLIVAGVYIGIASGGYAGMFAKSLIYMGASLIFGGVAQLLTVPPGANEQDKDKRASYVFGGPVNTTQQGYPVPILYGKLRIGGALISASIEAEDYDANDGGGGDTGGTGFRFIGPSSFVINMDSIDGASWSIDLNTRDGAGAVTYTLDSVVPDSSMLASLVGRTLSATHIPTGSYSFSITADDTSVQISRTYTLDVSAFGMSGITPSSVTIRGGDSGGGGGGSAPSESPDSLFSRAVARIMDVVSEGPIAGLIGETEADKLKSIFLNDTPIANEDDTQNFTLLSIDHREGYPDQTYVTGFTDAEVYVQVGQQIINANGTPTPKVITISETQYDAVRLTLGVPQLTSQQPSGSLDGSTIDLRISLQCAGGGYVVVKTDTIDGKTTTNYQRSYRVNCKAMGPAPWDIKIEKLTEDSHGAVLNNKLFLDAYSKITDTKLTYSNSALVGFKIDAKNFSNAPTRAYLMKGMIIRVPNNYDSETRAYSGSWDGTFKLSWTDNPAWVFYDLLVNPRYGAGDWINTDMVDKWSLYDIAQYCDQLIPDGKGGDGTIPRFTCNLYLQTREEAFKVIGNLASIFRGMAFWGSGTIFASQDRPATPVYLYTNSNVIDGVFSYQGSAWKARHNSAIVAWVDPDNGYRGMNEYIAIHDAISSMGFLNEVESSAFGCASQAQAHYFGRWQLYTELWETEVVTFNTGYEGIMARPGELVYCQDQDREQIRHGGRIISSDGTVHVLDAPVDTTVGSYSLRAVLTDGTIESKSVISSANSATITTAAFSSSPQSMAEWILSQVDNDPAQYRVISISEKSTDIFEISALRHYPGKFDLVESLLELDTPPGGSGGPPSGPPTGTSSTPKNVVVTSYSSVEPDHIATNVRCSWTPVLLATEYDVEWKKDNDNFTRLAPQSTASVELKDVVPGVYIFRVCATVNGVKSPWGSGSGTVIGDARDDYFVAEEKPALVSEWTRVQAEYAALIAAAAKASGVSTTTFVDSYNNLGKYLTDVSGFVYSYGGTSYPVVGWNTVPGVTVYLGKNGFINWESWWQSYYTAANTLKLAISNAGLDPGLPTDTFRPLYMWDFQGGTLPVVIDRGAMTFAAAASPDDQTATRFNTDGTSQLKFLGTQFLSALTVPGKDGYILQARIKFKSGTWRGRCYYNSGSGYTNYRGIAAPVVDQWSILTWDLRLATSSVINKVISGFALDFTSDSGAVEIDWVGVGVYGTGSRKDYDDALNSLIDDLLARADTSVFSNVVIGNVTNLIPNADSEKNASTLPANSIGLNALYNPAGGKQYDGSGCRQVGAGQIDITPKMSVVAGEAYYIAAQLKYNTSSTCMLEVVFSDASVAQVPAVSTSYTKETKSFAIPGGVTWMKVTIKGTVNGGYADQLMMRKSADSWLVVDGGIMARHIVSGAIQTYHLSIGPWLTFRANTGGMTLIGMPDGSFKRGSDAERTVAGTIMVENSADPRIYMDETRVYPNGVVVTYESYWGGTVDDRGFIINMGSPWSTSSQSATQIRWSSTSVYVEGMAGIGNKATTIKTLSAPSPTSSNDKLSVVYYPSLQKDPTGANTIRMRVLCNGTSIGTLSDTELGSYGGVKGGYAGLLLGGSPGSGVRCTSPQFGSGWVTIQDGAVTADKLAASLAILGEIHSPTYDGSPTVPCGSGFKISGIPYNAKGLDGATYSVSAEFGADVLIAGYKALTIADRAMTTCNRILNGLFFYTILPWSGAGTDVPTYSAVSKTAGTGSAHTGATATGGTTKTFSGSIVQSFVIPKPAVGQNVEIRFQYGVAVNSNTDSSDYSISVYIINYYTGVESLIDSVAGSFAAGGQSLTWAQKITSSVYSLISAGGDFGLRISMSGSVTHPGSGAASTIDVYIDEVFLIG